MTPTGLVFGKYEVSHRLAIGGMGEVYYAKAEHQPMVLKMLLPELAREPGFIEQFLDEAKLAARLDHPNIVSLSEVGVWNGTYVIAMEYLHGRDVSELLKSATALKMKIPVVVAASIVADAARGLGYAHQLRDEHGRGLSVVHRDISPQNVMVRDDGVAKVVDFGIARATTRSTRTATGVVKGKLSYMSPEQVRGEAPTARSDQFALGLVLWELLTQERAYPADNDVGILKQVMEAKMARPSLKRVDVPEALDAVVMKMLATEPSERFERCEHVADALAQILPGHVRADVAAFMKRLGVEELDKKRHPPTPTLGNVVIAMGRKNAKSATGEVTKVSPRVQVEVTTGKIETPRTPLQGIGAVLNSGAKKVSSSPSSPGVETSALPQGVIYSHTVKSFLEQVLVRRKLLTAEFAAEVQALGVDVQNPRDIPYENWIKLLRMTARQVSPTGSIDESLELLGREVFRGFANSMLGRLQVMAMRMLGPRRTLLKMGEQFQTAGSVSQIEVRQVTPTNVVFMVKNLGDVPSYLKGLVHEGVSSLGAKNLSVAVTTNGPIHTICTVTWD